VKLWGGRFEKDTDKTLENFGASIHFDHIFWQEDILGSLAHINALHDAKVISFDEADKLCQGLKNIERGLLAGTLCFKVEEEDVHMNIERMLFDEVGELAGKVHTGRSRNDQVALDMRLYLRRQLICLIENCVSLQEALLFKANEHIDTLFPGYTHLQRAEPIRLAHHWLAYNWMFLRDIKRLQQTFHSTNMFPLGAGALAGNSFEIDQQALASKLHFDKVYPNSMDAVSDRDYLVEFLSAASLIMMHLSKLSEELIIWSSQEFAFIEIDDAYCTGSSMMPQKKNPDAAELIRGKTGRVYGSLIGMLTMLKGLPLAYNKDLQEDKECVFDTLKTLNGCITIMGRMIATLKVNQHIIEKNLKTGYLNATEIANYLVRKGVSFRKAHEIVAKLVNYSVSKEKTFEELTLTELKTFSKHFDTDSNGLFSIEQVIEGRNNFCGTAKVSLMNQITLAQESLQEVKDWLNLKHVKTDFSNK
jgi:argininosuccinate lyase